MAAHNRNRNWLWFFAVLGVLAAAAVSISWVYNAKQQLTQEELRRHRALWDKAGPRDYTLEYFMAAGDVRQMYTIKVRDGQVISAVYKADEKQAETPLQPYQYGYYSMVGLFDIIESNLELDAAKGRRPYNHADFDPGDGHLLRYVRYGSDEKRVVIEILRFEPGPPS